MARLTGPDPSVSTVYLTSGANAGKAAAQGLTVPLYADSALTIPADVQTLAGVTIPGSPPTRTVDAYSQIPLFLYPDGVDTVWTSINGGPATPLYARTDDRLDAIGAQAATAVLTAQSKSASFTAVAQFFYLVDTTAATVLAALPSANVANQRIAFKRVAGTNPVTLNRTGSDTIGAVATTADITLDNESWELISSGTGQWNLVSGNKSLASLDARYAQLATIDAKGDLLVGTADNVLARLAAGSNGQILAADSTQAAGMRWSALSPSRGEALTAGGECVADRRLCLSGGNSTGSGILVLTYFTAQVSEVINNLVLYTSASAAATVTLAKFGVYSVAANGNLTLVASTANDPTLMTAAFNRYSRPLTASWSKAAGQRYAVGLLVVATTTPTLVALNSQFASVFSTIFSQEPRVASELSGQSDLPGSVASGSLLVSRALPYVEMLP